MAESRSGPALTLARAGLILAAVAAGYNVFRFSSTDPFGPLQAALFAAGLLLAAGGSLWDQFRGSRVFSRSGGEIAVFAGQAVQVALLVAVIHAFQIESPVFYDRIIPLAALGFLVNHLLPLPWRLPFFTLLSFLGIHVVFGTEAGLWLVGLGCGLILIGEAPVPFAARVALLVLAGAALALLRADVVPAPFSGAIWPILGSMFMFRIVVYFYDLKHRREPFQPWRALSYFFMLPNVVFPLFPVVDYTTWQRTYYAAKKTRDIYARGIRWMLLGVLHLVLYRWVYQYLTMSPSDVTSPETFGQYVVANFLLYFRVSGQFHLIVGILHLFGCYLPETHHLFFYSSSFNDFWRRINIYWKDFMMKVVYFPVFFRMRKMGESTGLIVATILVFLVTWITHSYQWFWILGEWLLSLTDMAFWAILAVAVIANTLWEMNRGKKSALTPKVKPWADTAVLGLRTAAFFAMMSVLWSLWTAPTFEGWTAMVAAAGWSPGALAKAVGAILVAAAALTLGFKVSEALKRTRTGGGGVPAGAFAVPLMLVMLALGNGAVAGRLPVKAQELVRDLRVPGLNRVDQETMQRGYYEKLTKVNRFNSQLWEVYAQKGRTAPPEIRRPTGDFQGLENIPLLGVQYKGQPLRTNQWGMRDRDYEKAKPANTFRIALMGASYVMGSGVGDGEPFEWVLEERLRQESSGSGGPDIEILNFAVGTLSSAQQLFLLRKTVFDFEPDVVFLVCPATDADLLARYLYRTREEGVEIPYPFVRDVLDRAGVDDAPDQDEAIRRLGEHRSELLEWVYREFAEECRARGVKPVWAFLSLPGRTPDPALIDDQVRLAEAAGFETLDLRDVYDGHDPETLQVAPWDWHPNPQGHRIIADRLYRDFQERGVLP